jgi:hypothetical protein
MKNKEAEIMNYLEKNVFNPILNSPNSSDSLKRGVRLTIIRLKDKDAKGMLHYYWSAVIGTDRSTKFAKQMKSEGFTRFEEILEDFREKFNDKWLRTK